MQIDLRKKQKQLFEAIETEPFLNYNRLLRSEETAAGVIFDRKKDHCTFNIYQI